jgi:predicted cupin superfamily sugar epimerase
LDPEHVHPRAEQLIRDLALQPHPEGGHYAEVHRSGAVTSIYFLLAAGEISRWHRVRSEEIWHFYEGAPLELLQLTPAGADLERILLGPVDDRHRPVHCVPAHHWQAARPRGEYTFVGCTVAPAFQFADFALLRDSPALADAIGRRHPSVAQFV